MKFLVTGGAGYIGSTVVSALEDAGHQAVILDSLVTGRIEFTRGKIFYLGDIADRKILTQIFVDHPDIFAVLHCAALIVVPESVEKPYEYYRENVAKSNEMFHILYTLGCQRIVFSSSAAIYDKAENFMVTEDSPLAPNSPYSRTKYMMEMILQDTSNAYNMRGIALRYFNPIGADPKMRSGMHVKEPSHVLGKLVDTALGKQDAFTVTGTNWPTRDGSGIRDYIHVWDLAQAHVKSLAEFDQVFERTGDPNINFIPINLGSGKGVTVFELVNAFERVYGKKINIRTAPPRPGDVAGAYANADRAKKLLGWETQLSIEDGIRTALEWGKIRESILHWD